MCHSLLFVNFRPLSKKQQLLPIMFLSLTFLFSPSVSSFATSLIIPTVLATSLIIPSVLVVIKTPVNPLYIILSSIFIAFKTIRLVRFNRAYLHIHDIFISYSHPFTSILTYPLPINGIIFM